MTKKIQLKYMGLGEIFTKSILTLGGEINECWCRLHHVVQCTNGGAYAGCLYSSMVHHLFISK